MTDADSFPKDLKEALPLYENQKPEVQQKRKFVTVKKVAAAALVLYLGSTAAYYAAPNAMHYLRDAHSRHAHAHHHHGHHGGPHGGPDHFYLPNQLVRSNIAEDRAGVPLFLDVVVLDSKSSLPVENINVDLWQADAQGRFSGFHHRGPPHGDKGLRHGKGKGPSHHGSEREDDEKRPMRSYGQEHGENEEENDETHHSKDEDEFDDNEEHDHLEEEKKEKKEKKHGKHDKHDKDGEKPHHKPHGPHHGPPPPHGPPPHGRPHHGGPPPHGPPPHGRPHHGKGNHTKGAVEDSEWLRGVQTTNDEGKVSFTTIFQDKIHYKIHSPSAEDSLVRFDAAETSELKSGKLVFGEELSTKVHELEAYQSPKDWKMKKHSKGKCHGKKGKSAPEMITEVEYVEEGVVESGLRAKVTILVDGSEYVHDEFTDSD